MAIRCILVPTAPELPFEQRLEAAVRVAQRTQSHITTLFVRPDPAAIAASLPELVESAGLDLATIEHSGLEAARRARDKFEAWCDAQKIPTKPGRRLDTTFALWREEVGDLASFIALLGRVHDLIIVDGRMKGGPLSAGALDASIFSSGRPALVVGERFPMDLLRHVVIAWNGSLEGARAVSQSLALLHDAEKVSVFTAPSSKAREGSVADLRRYLRYHGILAEPAMIPSKQSGTVGEALLATCHKGNASLLVMGAYTRSRIHESFLGGVTKHVLDNATIPVLLAY
jgi:nucleotide-binding universal stress UspA family protein